MYELLTSYSIDNIHFDFVNNFVDNYNFDYFDNFLDNFDNLEDVKVTLTNDQINKLKQIQLNKTNISEYTNDCAICLEKCILNEKLLVLKCTHYFHYDCIYQWLSKESTKCPTCRTCSR